MLNSALLELIKNKLSQTTLISDFNITHTIRIYAYLKYMILENMQYLWVIRWVILNYPVNLWNVQPASSYICA